MAKKDPVYEEVKNVLLNKVTLNLDNQFIVVKETRFALWGPAEGSHKLRTLGMTIRKFVFISDYNNKKAIFSTSKAMNNIGRGVWLESVPNSAACIAKSAFFYPVVVVFAENEEKILEATLYTPRTFTSLLAIRAVLRRFEKATEDILIRSDDVREKGLNGLKLSFEDFKVRHKEKALAKKKEKLRKKEEKLQKKRLKELDKVLSDKSLYKGLGIYDDEEDEEEDKKIWDGENWVLKSEYEARLKEAEAEKKQEPPREGQTKRPSGRPQGGQAARPAGRPQGGQAGRPQGGQAARPAGRPQGGQAGRPQGGQAARPSGRPQGGQAGRPQGGQAARPAGRPQGGQSGRPSGKQTGRPQGRPSGKQPGDIPQRRVPRKPEDRSDAE